MKYGSLKGQEPKSFKIGALEGGLDYSNPPDSIADNCISSGVNMWYKDSRLQTRPGFKGDAISAVNTMIYGVTGELEYEVTDTVIYRFGEYYRIATANVTTDDYAHYTYVYLLNNYGEITPIGHFAFMRLASDSFYLPTHINFFNGKPHNGGGIYAMITVRDMYNYSMENYYIYEINADFTEWERVYDYYIPTSLINGRGNKYQIAKNESGFSLPEPVVLEAQNMLEGSFYSYFTSDGYSNSFRLPFNNLDNAEVSCRIYYNLENYVEWVISTNHIRDTQKFNDQDVIAYIDRSTGTLYFKIGPDEFPIPVMQMCGLNNIKVTATKSVSNGIAKIVKGTCSIRHNSKLLIAGGENSNTVYTADFDNPLYFPVTSCVDIGESNSKITGLSSQQGKVIVFKADSLHLLSVKEGETVNEISLLSDNDKVFKEGDILTCEQLSNSIGCDNKSTISLCDGRTFWLGCDNKVYTFDVSGKKIIDVCICDNLGLNDYTRRYATAIGGGGYYFLISGKKLLVVDVKTPQKAKMFFWETPDGFKVESGFYFAGKHSFLCVGSDSSLAYIATLEGKTDSLLYYAEDDKSTILQKDITVNCEFSTKYYCFGNVHINKNIEGIYFNLSAKGKVKIEVNDRYKTQVNFGFLNADYDKFDYKSVRLSPHIFNTKGVIIKLESDSDISIGEIEIRYREIG